MVAICLFHTNYVRRDILKQLHELYQGTLRTKQRARLTVYWPGIDDIDNLISQLGPGQLCQHNLKHNRYSKASGIMLADFIKI